MKGAEKVFRKLFVPHLEGLGNDVWADNPKGRLQEYVQGKWKESPSYRIVSTEGPSHECVFTVEVKLPDGTHASGNGRSKQYAEAQALAREYATKYYQK